MTDLKQRTHSENAQDPNERHVDAFFERQDEMEERERMVSAPDAVDDMNKRGGARTYRNLDEAVDKAEGRANSQ